VPDSRNKAVNLKVRQWTAIVAAAVVLAYVGIVAVTEVRDFALWPASLAWLGVFAAICGALLALISDGAAWSIVVASVLAVMIFAGLWSYIFWLFLGEFVSLLEIIVSNLFIFQVLPRSAVVLITTVLLGLLGVVAATIFLPDRYRP
jgi:hypothetical protein